MRIRNEKTSNITKSKYNRYIVIRLFGKFKLLTFSTRFTSNNEGEAANSSEKRQ